MACFSSSFFRSALVLSRQECQAAPSWTAAAARSQADYGTWQVAATKINTEVPVPDDLDIAQSAVMKPIQQLAKEMGLADSDYEPYGHFVAKITGPIPAQQQRGKYVIVTGISPTKSGEGKTTTTLGIAQALSAHLARPAIACIRQASQGLTFGIKGGCAGGGYAQAVPMEKLNLHLTGDFHAIAAAHNLLAAAITSRMIHEKNSTDEQLLNRMCPRHKTTGRYAVPAHLQRRLARLGLSAESLPSLSPEQLKRLVRLDVDPERIAWARVVDCNDKMLRNVVTSSDGISLSTAFEITPASEVMAIMSQAADLADVRARLSRMVVAYDTAGQPLTADDFGTVGAMAVLLKDAIHPSLLQTLEGGPVLVHTGPFASIAHGCSSIIADRLALSIVGASGFAITEAGFGSDLGFEKFANIKCRASGMHPDLAVITTTVRGLKGHSNLSTEADQLEHLKDGLKNLEVHVRNVKNHGIPVVVALNRFQQDTNAEIELVQKAAVQRFGADEAVAAEFWAKGGAGAVDLAQAVIRASQLPNHFRHLYSLEDTTVSTRIQTIARQVYGAADIVLSDKALQKIELIVKNGFDKMPVCMAKTPSSLSHDPKLKGAPHGFLLPIADVRPFVGAGHIVAYVGDISLMPALPTNPSFFGIDITSDGRIVGLS